MGKRGDGGVLRGIDVLRRPVLWARAECPDDPRRAELLAVAVRLESFFTQRVQRVTDPLRRVRHYVDAACAPFQRIAAAMRWSRRPGSLGSVWYAFVNAWADDGRARRVHRRARTAATRARAAAMVRQAELRLQEAMGALCRRPEFISRRKLYRLLAARQATERGRRVDLDEDDVRMQCGRLCAKAAEGDPDAEKTLRQVDVRRVGAKADKQAPEFAANGHTALRRRALRPRVPEAALLQAFSYALAECGAGPRPLQFRQRKGAAAPPWHGTRVVDPLSVALHHLFDVLRRRTHAHVIALTEGNDLGAASHTGRRAQSAEQDRRRRTLRAYLHGERSAEATRLLLGMKTCGAVRTAACRLAAEDAEETLHVRSVAARGKDRAHPQG